MLRLIIVAALAYLAWRYFGLAGAAVVIAAYIVLSAILWTMTRAGASSARKESQRRVSSQLSEAEKAHFAAVREHQQTMHEHKSQFDPELRKRQ